MRNLDGQGLKQFISAANRKLELTRAEVDALNVFPVPDGDTGANMSLTLKSAWEHAASCEDESASKVAEAISLGSLMGARGNSGVILSQIFRGFALGVEGKDVINGGDVATALQRGVDTAYEAVMKPVEGTILTVARDAARAGRKTAQGNDDVVLVLKSIVAEAERSLERTPELLPVLKKAGVVDAGGKGLVYILSAGLQVLMGEDVELACDSEISAPIDVDTEAEDVGKYPYDSQLLVRGVDMDLGQLRSELEPLGDSLLVVGTDSLCKVHVHTDRPDEVLMLCLKVGSIDEVEILDMRRQQAEFAGSKSEANEDANEKPDQVAVVAVALGDGLIEVFKSLGAQAVVAGGQTMNPSIEDILSAIESVNSSRVIVLPNNGNVVAAAQQAGEMAECEVEVLETKTIPQGLGALFAYRPDADMGDNVDSMSDGAAAVRTGQVTFAVRDAECANGKIERGSVLGLVEGEIEVTGQERTDVAVQTVARLIDDETEVITLFYGENVTDAEGEDVVTRICEQYEDIEVELRYGGQPHYFYIISAE